MLTGNPFAMYMQFTGKKGKPFAMDMGVTGYKVDTGKNFTLQSEKKIVGDYESV